ncbi:DedA family protein [Corynebacterium sp. HMSC04H06]|uniref:DedA family protein n=1 Tax=Corynebacterium sp. HMSC04H06 TaxID=1581050 RepID=UPI0008A11628|nr:DedA family protein [Corynebacterium sp. HMSC04H06]OFS23330.1 hypothetical protein HMPREF3067_01555 [Corynebacterium sp. HMSC04H06]
MVDSILQVIESIMTTDWVYPVIGCLIFLDCFFPVLPSEIPLNLVGAWAGSQGVPSVTVMFFTALFAAILGDNLCFLLGTRFMPYLQRLRRGSKAYEGLLWVKRHMRRSGGAAIIIARFIPSARLFMTILLGSVRYPWPLFFFFDSIGVAIWAFQALAIGYLGGMAFSDSPLAAMLVSIVAAVVIGFAIQWLQNRILDWKDTRNGYAETP